MEASHNNNNNFLIDYFVELWFMRLLKQFWIRFHVLNKIFYILGGYMEK